MPGVSRQAVSKWELGEESTPVATDKVKAPDRIRIISPNEGVIISTSKVTRSQQFKGGRNSPRYALFASDGNYTSFLQNTFPAWYRNLEDITKEMTGIMNAPDAGAASYTLRYSVKCRQNLFRTMED